MSNDFREECKRQRQSCGISQRDFAALVGLSKNGYQGYELGKFDFKAETESQIWKVIGEIKMLKEHIQLQHKKDWRDIYTMLMACHEAGVKAEMIVLYLDIQKKFWKEIFESEVEAANEGGYPTELEQVQLMVMGNMIIQIAHLDFLSQSFPFWLQKCKELEIDLEIIGKQS